MDYRILHETHELAPIVELQCAIWGMPPRDAASVSIIHALILAGGVVIGAFDGAQMIGMSLATPWRRGVAWGLWSHMTGVLPAYQQRGVGFRLKQMQRMWALEHDYPVIRWTFDPMQRRNASFNMRQLGAMSAVYHVDLYGDTLGELNAGLPTDRLEVAWPLHDPLVDALATGERPPPRSAGCDPVRRFVVRVAPGQPVARADLSGGLPGCCCVQIPQDIGRLKQADLALARAWQQAIRQMCQTLFARGYTIVDVDGDGVDSWYVLASAAQWQRLDS
jgi:predicted GNAT superfamily acetyltransferase